MVTQIPQVPAQPSEHPGGMRLTRLRYRPQSRENLVKIQKRLGPYMVRIDTLLSMFLLPDFECLQQLAALSQKTQNLRRLGKAP